jgi:NAD(P)-dependent dehydrogenase (short-subunit alcohol dehydrogenase family)
MSGSLASGSQIAIVTGGSRGLGRDIVLALSERGVHVIALARDEEGLKDLKTRESRTSIRSSPMQPTN